MHRRAPVTADDIDIAALVRAVWARKFWLAAVVIGAGLAVMVGLSFTSPRYTSEARILIDNDETAFTRPISRSESGGDRRSIVEPEAVASQVQVLLSRDLALKVVNKLNLLENPEFNKAAAEPGAFKSILIGLGLAKDRRKMVERERVLDRFAKRLSVYAVEKSRVIVVEFSSKNPRTAAEVANALATEYLTWQQREKLQQNRDASTWLSTQIEELRGKVADSEARVEQFRSKTGLYAGRNNVTLNAQQLSELNSQLILAKAQRTEAEARARLIKKMLRDKGDVGAASDVLRSELIQRLLGQRVQVQRQLAELSATLMPSHPRIKQLRSELSDVRQQIRQEARKVVKGLENEAQIAGARERSLRNSLDELKQGAAKVSENQIKLRALEREAKSNKDLLESYLARYRDASARRDALSVPAHASIISRAHVSNEPSFPKKGPITALVMAAVALLSLAFILARELITAQRAVPVPRAAVPEPHAGGPEPHAAAPVSAADYAPAPRAADFAAEKPEPIAPVNGSSAPPPAQPRPAASTAGSRDALKRKVLRQPGGGPVRSVLVTGQTAEIETVEDAIALARDLTGAGRQVALVDVSEGATSVSGRLGLPRTPGIRELVGGTASFEQVVRLDPESAVQVFTAGDPRLPAVYAADPQAVERVLRALDEAYDTVVLCTSRSATPYVLGLFGGTRPALVVVSDEAARSNGSGRRLEDIVASASVPVELIRYERGRRKAGPLGQLSRLRQSLPA